MTTVTHITFNTGRCYTREGQVVTARFDADAETIHFMDHSRGIAGTIKCPTYEQTFQTRGGFAQFVMAYYDRCEYRVAVPTLERQDTVYEFTI